MPEILRSWKEGRKEEGKTAYFIRDKFVISENKHAQRCGTKVLRSNFQTTHFDPDDAEDETEPTFG